MTKTNLNKSLKAAVESYIQRYGTAAMLELMVEVLENKSLVTSGDLYEAKMLREYLNSNYEKE